MSKPYFGFLQAMAEEMEAKRRSISASCFDEEDWVQFAASVGLLVTDEDRDWYRATYEEKEG